MSTSPSTSPLFVPAPSISIVVATYNRPDALEAVIESLFRQSDRDFEIIIADDGSGPATAACVAALEARATVPLTHVWQPDQGFRLAMARNRGIRQARGHYLIFLDGDCIAQPDLVAQHRKLAASGFMVTGSRILLDQAFTLQVLADKRQLHELGILEMLRLRAKGHLNKMLPLILSLPDIGRARKSFSFRRIKGCNLGIWRADLEAINGFDESFTGWGHEDADVVLRLFNAGVLRKDGAFATEVLHLWHREAQREQESSNKRVVQARLLDKTIRAVRGLQS